MVCTVDTVDTVYTIETAKTLACMPIYIVGKVRTLLEPANELLSKMLGDGPSLMGDGPGWSGLNTH